MARTNNLGGNTMNALTNEYDQQAARFCRDTETTIDTKFLYSGPYFDEDKENRDIYQVTITRKGQTPWVFKFGQSLVNSRDYVEKACAQRSSRGESGLSISKYKKEAIRPPSDYSVLSAITKYDPGTFKEFCAEMGYSDDSRKAEKTYFAVQEQYQNVMRLFRDVMEALEEIQ